MKINSSDRTNFCAIPISKARVCAKGLEDSYTMFELNPADKPFLKDVYRSINLPHLMPGKKSIEYEMWDWVIDNSLNGVICEKNRGILLADRNNIPCGILNFRILPSEYEIKRIATWPVNKSERKLLAGKTLIMEVYNRFLEDKNKLQIILNALKESAFDPVCKYMEMGLKMCGGYDYSYESMAIKRQNVPGIVEKFKDKIKIEKIQNQNQINLYDVLTINNK